MCYNNMHAMHDNMCRGDQKMEFTDLIFERKSIRAYKEEAIDHAALMEILKQARRAPSWKNLQTSRCYVVETPDTLEELRTKGLPSFNQKSSANAVLVVTTFVKDVVGFTQGKPDNEAGNLWGAYDLGLHDAYLVLAASNAGYDTLIMGIRNADVIRNMLNIPENEQIMSVIAVGKRASDVMEKPRKELDEVVTFI